MLPSMNFSCLRDVKNEGKEKKIRIEKKKQLSQKNTGIIK